jgi:hypothetical protein
MHHAASMHALRPIGHSLSQSACKMGRSVLRGQPLVASLFQWFGRKRLCRCSAGDCLVWPVRAEKNSMWEDRKLCSTAALFCYCFVLCWVQVWVNFCPAILA